MTAARDHTIGRPRQPIADADTRRRTRWIVLVVLCLGTLAVFLPLRHADFLNYDDNVDVTANPMTRAGLTWAGLWWAATNTPRWIPLTWLSHMLDCQFFGLDAGAHHLSSVALHVANAALLLHVLLRLTGAVWPSAVVAALFAIHPQHVEPVAWISSRPHLLSALGWLAALLAYVRYTERPTRGRFLLVGLCMALSLLNKGMAITLPVTLLLLDYWPLRRWPEVADRSAAWHLLREKLPLALLALAATLMQFVMQLRAWQPAPAAAAPLARRVANALVGYATYIAQMLWPTDLALPYPLHAAFPPAWQIIGSLLGLIAVTAVVARVGRERRYLVTGWLWYLVTLVPVIGFVQIGTQSMADRYTYMPLIGLFVMLAWGAADLGRSRPRVRAMMPAAAAVALLVCAGLTRVQIGYWHDSVTLFRHTLAVTTDNPIAENNLGVGLRLAGNRDEARAHFAAAVRIDPAYAEAHNNLGLSLAEAGADDEAEAHFQQALDLIPTLVGVRENLAMNRLRRGDAAGALALLRAGVALAPNQAAPHLALAQGLERAGRWEDARDAYERALQLDPALPGAHAAFARALQAAGALDAAVAQYREELRHHPDDGDAENELGALLQAAGQRDEARAHFAAALRINPNDPEAHNNLGVLLFEDGRVAEAEAYFREALRLKPAYAGAHVDLGMVRLHQGNPAAAREHFQAALQLEPENAAARDGLAQARAALGDPPSAER